MKKSMIFGIRPISFYAGYKSRKGNDRMNMELLKIGVGRFIFGKGVIEQLPDEILRYGKRALLIGGKTTQPMIRRMVEKDIEEKGIEAVWVLMEEPNSVDFATRLADRMRQEAIDVIVAIGGGKCMDLCKVASDMAKCAVITVPTSVATCAASSAVSIMYTKEEARYDCSIPNEKEVNSLIADVDIIGASPKRLFAAGILDSIAKLPETVNGRTNLVYPNVSLHKYMAYNNSLFIYDFLTRYGVQVYENPMEDEELLQDLILINLIVTSLVSGFSKGSDQLAVAHGLYDAMRAIFPVESKNALHGEIVAVGVLMQMRFNGDTEEEYQKILGMMKTMKMPLTLRELGVEPTEENIAKLKAANIEKNHIVKKEELERLDIAFAQIS